MSLKELIPTVFKSQTPTEAQLEYEAVKEELRSLRKEMFLLEKFSKTAGDTEEFRESMSHELNAKREREHVLIKKAKTLYGETINIQTSLREYNEQLIK